MSLGFAAFPALREESVQKTVLAECLEPLEAHREALPVCDDPWARRVLAQRVVGDAGDREPKRCEGAFGKKSTALGVVERPHPLIALAHRPGEIGLQVIADAPRENADHQVIRVGPATRAFEVEQGRYAAAPVPEDVIAKEVAMNETRRYPGVSRMLRARQRVSKRRNESLESHPTAMCNPVQTLHQILEVESSFVRRQLGARHMHTGERFTDALRVFLRDSCLAAHLTVAPGGHSCRLSADSVN